MSGKKHINQTRTASSSFTGLLFIFLTLVYSTTLSQNLPAQPWPNLSQTYLKLAVTKPGLYSITGRELRNAGLPVEQIKPNTIQLFQRGKELAIELLSKNQDQLDDQSTISFYGEGNNGASDSVLYVHSKAMPFGSYPLYSDTAFYFLTWRSDGQSGKRIHPSIVQSIADTLDYHLEQQDLVFNSHYNTGSFSPTGTGFNDGMAITAYDAGEGWTGPPLINTWQNIDINTTNLSSDLIDKVNLMITLVGRTSGSHTVELYTGTSQNPGRKIATINLTNYQPETYQFQLITSDLEKVLQPGNRLSIVVRGIAGTSSISYVRWRYPRQTQILQNEEIRFFHFDPKTENTFLKTGNTSAWKFYDISDPFNVKTSISASNGIAISGAKHILAAQRPKKVDHIFFVNHLQPDLRATDYLILTHPDVRKAKDGTDLVQAYANYRSSVEGGLYKTAILNIQDVYDHYNSGEAGPAGIRNMIAHLSSLGKLKFLMIIGRSSDPQTSRKAVDPKRKDLIPNAGWPGSDLALAMQIDSISPDFPVVAIGRINASTAEEVEIYLHKVKQMEAEPASAPWRKRVLHLSGGRTYQEIDTFSGYMKTFSQKIQSGYLSAQIESKTKITEEPVEQIPIEESLNKGVALVTLFGHSGIDVTDVDIGDISDESRNYHNQPYYPAVIANGCATGSIFYSDKTISSNWIFTPDKGAVLFLAHTFNGSSTALKNYTASIYEVLADSAFTSQPFGIIQREAIRRNLRVHNTLSDLITAQQMNLHGDPAIRIFPATLPDYAFDSSAVAVSGRDGNEISTWSDSLNVRLVVNNYGRYSRVAYQLTISDTTKKIIYNETRTAVPIADTITIRIKNPFQTSGNLFLNAAIDPDNLLQEESKTNNHLQIRQYVRQGGAFPLLPVSGFKTSQQHIELIAQIPDGIHAKEIVFEWDSTNNFRSSEKQTVPVEQSLARFQFPIPPGYTNVYWRVYMPTCPDRPSASHLLIFDPAYIEPLQLPEGIAFAVTAQQMQIQEGDSMRCEAVFRKLTNIPFADSLLVKVTHYSPAGMDISFQKLADTGLSADTHFRIKLPSVNSAGQHRIAILFNADHLPELLTDNNEVKFEISVIPDQTPPLLFVTFDDRLIENGEEVNASPSIKITLQDENPFLLMTDTTGISVYMKEDCAHCIERRIWLKNAVVQSGQPNQLDITLNNLPALLPGKYVLRVIGHDRSRNRTPEYQINFIISARPLVQSIHVSPNPSHTFFRFQVRSQGSLSGKKMNITIADAHGRVLARKRHLAGPGISETIWEPVNLPSGIYFYRLESAKDQTAIPFAPDVNLSGKLILTR
ncbi:MAG TPA: C25 family cysteine peptidase [Dyadobacter sp.]|jgi:hypothetical protein|nr:C25 family cysteine peptidase [Dyadobacter sp.]